MYYYTDRVRKEAELRNKRKDIVNYSTDTFIDRQAVSKQLGITLSRIKYLMSKGWFPKSRFMYGKKCWCVREITAWSEGKHPTSLISVDIALTQEFANTPTVDELYVYLKPLFINRNQELLREQLDEQQLGITLCC